MIDLKFKRIKKEDAYDPNMCSYEGCHNLSDVIDATGIYKDKDLPLCELHWKIRCGELKTRLRKPRGVKS